MVDATLFFSSLIVLVWIRGSVVDGVKQALEVSSDLGDQKIIDNLQQERDFKFQYFLSCQIGCLIIRISMVLQFNSEIGPLIKIVQKMASDFLNFVVIYTVLLTMFSIVGNLNFLLYMPEFSSLFDSFITLLDASMGNYDFSIFD